MSDPKHEIGARGGHAIAEGEFSTAIGGDAGPPGPKPGGRGGDARATKRGSTVIGGPGGRGGAVEGMPGMDVSDDLVSDDAMGVYIEGGMGGEAPQLDGRGGRGGLPPNCGIRWHLKRPYWSDNVFIPGRGGDGEDSLQYRARRLIVEMIKAEYLHAPRYFTTEVWYERDAVPIEVINASLAKMGMNWQVSIEDGEYVMHDLPT